ncbi:MAG: hypothetical protein H6710_00205 [Myxococcales bacterium]|nr:hypothetical protein [Myxococcales bacterium]MCB9703195.1 hypothetical protein [Myxococcales bacterium]
MSEPVEAEIETETETTDANADANATESAREPRGGWRAIFAWPSLGDQVGRLQGYADRVDRATEEAVNQGMDAFESLTRLTRDNLQVGREVARTWRAAGDEAIRRSSELIAPLWRR